MNYKNILEHSKEIFHTLPIDDINLDLDMQEKDSQIVVTLPNYKNLHPETDWKTISKHFLSTQKNCLYVHIPFCTGICTYCSYVRKKEKDHLKYDQYLDALEKECKMQIESFGCKPRLESVYIGGGTPTILTTDQLERLFGIIQENYHFENSIEYTLEGCPETVDIDKINVSWKNGVNRVSLGVESFDDKILEIVNRRHRKNDTLEKLQQIKNSKVKHLDIDLINNLPLSTFRTTYDDAVTAVESHMPSVTLYHFHNKPKSITKKKIKNPDQHEQLFKHIIFDTVMKQNNFSQDNYDKYLRDDYVFQHQVQKWSKQINMLTLGVGCYGFVNNTQFFMNRNLSEYYETIKNNKIPLTKSKTLSREESLLRNFIMDIKIANTNFSIDQLQNKNKILQLSEPLINLGLIGFDNNYMLIKEKGKYFVDFIQRYYYSKLWH